MKPHQERVIQEHTELEGRTNKLRDFILFGVTKYNIYVPDDEIRRLGMQLNAMELYLAILEDRIKNFPVEPST